LFDAFDQSKMATTLAVDASMSMLFREVRHRDAAAIGKPEWSVSRRTVAARGAAISNLVQRLRAVAPRNASKVAAILRERRPDERPIANAAATERGSESSS
jgi:hypothetical protein